MNKEDVLKIEKIDNIYKGYKLLEYVAKTNKKKFNFTKLAEELTELNEICLKYVNKSKEFKPDREKFIEEIGDVTLRIYIILITLDITTSDIDKRFKYKVNKILQYIKEGKYENGI